MSSTQNAAALVALVLLEAVRTKREDFPAGSTQHFAPAEADRLLRLGVAVAADDPRARAIAAGASVAAVTREVIVEKVVEKEVIVEKVVEVRALSKEGGRFIVFKNEEKLAEFIAGFTDDATLAEFQALEFRRPEGQRPAILAAINQQFDAAEAARSKAE